MKTKSLTTIFLLAAMAVSMLASACSTGLTAEEKAARKAAQATADSIVYTRAVSLLDSGEFLIPASTVQIKGGRVVYSDSETTNFICARDGKATIQLASMRNPRPGVNGMGGITVTGDIKLVRRTIDKRGRGIWEFNINSPLTSCRMIVSVPKNSMRATVNVSGNFNGGNLTIMGDVIPFDPTKISLGRAI